MAHFRECELESPDEVAADDELKRQVGPQNHEESDDDDSLDHIYLIAESFLFETDPIWYLEANVKSFCYACVPATTIAAFHLSFFQDST